MNQHKQAAINAIRATLGDDLARAKSVWRNCTPDQMNLPYGQSGKTRAELLAEWQEHADKTAATIKWLESIPD